MLSSDKKSDITTVYLRGFIDVVLFFFACFYIETNSKL